MVNLKIYPYTMASEASKDLAGILDAMRVHPDGNYRPKMGHLICNFGNSIIPDWHDTAVNRGVRILNRPQAVGIAANKYKTLQLLQTSSIKTPAFTTSYQEAMNWFNQGYAVVERHKLSSSSGEGIRIAYREGGANANNSLQNAPLYTKYIFKEKEFRVHVFRGQVIDYIQKKKRTGAESLPNFDRFVYSVERGWVFVRDGAEHIQSVKDLAVQAVRALGLDFGAVDIVTLDGINYVLEVNSAPGLQGATLIKYANAIRQFMGVGPVSQEIISQYVIGREVDPPVQTQAASSASALGNAEMITLSIDKNTARTLKSLLNQLAL